MINTPCYVFNLDEFDKRVNDVKDKLGAIPLTYAMKANPMLLRAKGNDVAHYEVCSPGELEICIENDIAPNKIIYSGVMKEEEDIKRALQYGVDIITAESIQQVRMIHMAAGCEKVVKVLLRLSSGNQFGMSDDDIDELLEKRASYSNIDFWGIHYYSGTQKDKLFKIQNDIDRLRNYLDRVKEKYDYYPKLVEYGPGYAVDYFDSSKWDNYYQLLDETILLFQDFNKYYPLGIEMGRYLAATCGSYISTVKDIKFNDNITYVILDGGIHHLNYYGQMMAMKVPKVYNYDGNGREVENYCLCGSLCTTSDVLVRNVELEKLEIGDKVVFEMVGAYSPMETPVLFLSRNMPRVFVETKEDGIILIRDSIKTYEFNN